ncbi:MAG: hypothetical protein ABIS07_02415 [Dokdonella sp.]
MTHRKTNAPTATRIPARLRMALAATALALLAACAGSTRPPARENGADVKLERIERKFALDKSIERIEIVNLHGEINVRNRDDAELGMHAVVQRLPPAFAHARFVERREHGTLHLEVAFDEAAGEKPGHVDIAVYLPSTSAIALVTRDARISVKRREGSIEAHSESGAILAASRGRLDLHTNTGQIRAIEIGKHWSGESRIETDSGRIVLLVPTFGDIVLDAATTGRLSNDFGLSVHAQDTLNVAHARYGRGTSPLIVRSRSGQIMLEQLVLMTEDAALPEDDD